MIVVIIMVMAAPVVCANAPAMFGDTGYGLQQPVQNTQHACGKTNSNANTESRWTTTKRYLKSRQVSVLFAGTMKLPFLTESAADWRWITTTQPAPYVGYCAANVIQDLELFWIIRYAYRPQSLTYKGDPVDIGLGWLSDLMRWASKVFPRCLHVDATQEGVMFTLSRARRIGPGLHLYWPPIQRPMIHPVKRDTIDLDPQTIPGGTDRPIGITISVTVVYTISDIMKALVETYNFPSTIKDRAQAGVIEACVGKSIQDLTQRYQKINNAITKKTQQALAPFGVNVETAFMSDFHLTNMHRVHGGMTVLPMAATDEFEEDE